MMVELAILADEKRQLEERILRKNAQLIPCSASLVADDAVDRAQIQVLRECPDERQGFSASRVAMTERANESNAGLRLLTYLENFVEAAVKEANATDESSAVVEEQSAPPKLLLLSTTPRDPVRDEDDEAMETGDSSSSDAEEQQQD